MKNKDTLYLKANKMGQTLSGLVNILCTMQGITLT